ncbi:hypothetical protein Vretimale_9880, partial [Volvox reticuliferus]
MSVATIRTLHPYMTSSKYTFRICQFILSVCGPSFRFSLSDLIAGMYGVRCCDDLITEISHVGLELDFKYGIFTNQTMEFREFNVIHATPQRQQQQKQRLLLQVINNPIVALRSNLRRTTEETEATCFSSVVAAAGGGGSGGGGAALGGGLLSWLAATVTAGGGSAAAEASMQALLDLDPVDLRSVSQAAARAVTHGNAALDITLPYSTTYRQILDDLAIIALRAVADAAAIATADASSPSMRTTAGRPPAAATTSNASVAAPPVGFQQQPNVVAASPAASEVGGDGDIAAAGLPDIDLFVPLAAAAARDFEAVTKRFPYKAVLRQLYWSSIGHSEVSNGASAGDKAVSPAGGSGSSNGSASSHHRTAATRRVWMPLGAALGGLVGLLILFGGYYLIVTSKCRRLLKQDGRTAQPPGAIPATTLVMTDIQNSTLLWEVLSASVMDACLATHHRIMRQAIECHSGYEVFTEGDAFAVAFHGPRDALGFALDVQTGLLEADWPQLLLEQPDASEVWALLRKTYWSVVQQPQLLHPTSLRRRPSRQPSAGGPPAVVAGCTGRNDVGDAAAAAASTPASGLMTRDESTKPLLEQHAVGIQPRRPGIEQPSENAAAVSDCDAQSPSLPFPTAAATGAAFAGARTSTIRRFLRWGSERCSAIKPKHQLASPSASASAPPSTPSSPGSLGVHAATRTRIGLIAANVASGGGGGGGGGDGGDGAGGDSGGGGGGNDVVAGDVFKAVGREEHAGALPAQRGVKLGGQCHRGPVLALTGPAPIQETHGSVGAAQSAATFADTCNCAPLPRSIEEGDAFHAAAAAAAATT